MNYSQIITNINVLDDIAVIKSIHNRCRCKMIINRNNNQVMFKIEQKYYKIAYDLLRYYLLNEKK